MLYIKLILCGLIITCCLSISTKRVKNIKQDAEKIREIAHCLLLFKEGIMYQRKSVVDILNNTKTEIEEVKLFFNEIIQLIKSNPEEPLSYILTQASNATLKLTPQCANELNTELVYVASTIEQTFEDICSDQIDVCCARIFKAYDRHMDKYKEKLNLNKKIGLVLGVALSLIIM